MELFNTGEYKISENPTPGSRYRDDILTGKQAEHLFGLFLVLEPGGEIPYHYHQTRESLVVALKGEVTETVEGKEYTVTAGDIAYIPAGEKHGMKNNSEDEFRFMEFYTGEPGVEDRVVVEK